MLAYGGPADSLDEYLRMAESTILESVRHFIRAIVEIYGPRYLRPPNEEEVTALLQIAEARGFPGMVGSIDCMHWPWEKCPVAVQGQFRGHHKKPTIILEAVASSDLWIWHAFFGLPGSLNDINVLHRSPVFDDLASGNAPQVSYTANGKEYNMCYYLADGIYPEWATLITDISRPQTRQQKLFTRKHHEYRKDVERAFGVLQAKYAICKGPARLWSQGDLKYIMDCIVILHNMGIHYERNMNRLRIEDYVGASVPRLDENRNVPAVRELIDKHWQIQSRPGHHELKQDLMQHVWARYGSE
jgi:hypothetical protein